MSFETTALLVTWAALALLALVVAGLVRQVHHLTRPPRTPELSLGTGVAAPAMDRLFPEPGQATVLLFLGDECPACEDVFQEALSLTGAPPMRAIFADGALDGEPPANLRILTGQAEMFETYQIPATPFAVIVGADGRIRRAEPVGSVHTLHVLAAEAGGRAYDDAELNGSAR